MSPWFFQETFSRADTGFTSASQVAKSCWLYFLYVKPWPLAPCSWIISRQWLMSSGNVVNVKGLSIIWRPIINAVPLRPIALADKYWLELLGLEYVSAIMFVFLKVRGEAFLSDTRERHSLEEGWHYKCKSGTVVYTCKIVSMNNSRWEVKRAHWMFMLRVSAMKMIEARRFH